MKTICSIIILSFVSLFSYGQFGVYSIDFDDIWSINYHITIDTLTNPNNTWQRGAPNKTLFNAAYSAPNVIVTDTLNAVPANDTSTFYLIHERDNSEFNHAFGISFWFQMDGDSTDFGTIEISPDTGNTWVNMLTEDITYNFHWQGSKPTLKGSTSEWQNFYVRMDDWAMNLGDFPVAMTADTILFRFTYITDNNSDPRDGWIIDNFTMEDWFEGVPEIQNDNLISISPNPTSDQLKIHSTSTSDNSSIQILNSTGQILYDNPNFKGETVDTRQFTNGIYVLKYSEAKNFSIKRFVVQH